MGGRYNYQYLPLITLEVRMISCVVKSLNILFTQLGLPDDDASINEFVSSHRPLSADVPLELAPWWTPSQASFLSEAINYDSDWSGLADMLNSMLR